MYELLKMNFHSNGVISSVCDLETWNQIYEQSVGKKGAF